MVRVKKTGLVKILNFILIVVSYYKHNVYLVLIIRIWTNLFHFRFSYKLNKPMCLNSEGPKGAQICM